MARTHVLPLAYLGDKKARVTAVRVDDPERHKLVLNTARTRFIRQLTREPKRFETPVRIRAGYEVRLEGELLALALNPDRRMPNLKAHYWLAIMPDLTVCAWIGNTLYTTMRELFLHRRLLDESRAAARDKDAATRDKAELKIRAAALEAEHGVSADQLDELALASLIR